jgi:hypothetical protein
MIIINRSRCLSTQNEQREKDRFSLDHSTDEQNKQQNNMAHAHILNKSVEKQLGTWTRWTGQMNSNAAQTRTQMCAGGQRGGYRGWGQGGSRVKPAFYSEKLGWRVYRPTRRRSTGVEISGPSVSSVRTASRSTHYQDRALGHVWLLWHVHIQLRVL